MFDVQDERGYWTSDVAALIDFRNKPTLQRALDVVWELTGAYCVCDGDPDQVKDDAENILDLYLCGYPRSVVTEYFNDFEPEPPRPVETAFLRARELHPEVDTRNDSKKVILRSVRAQLQPRDARGRFVAAN